MRFLHLPDDKFEVVTRVRAAPHSDTCRRGAAAHFRWTSDVLVPTGHLREVP